jgi:hypothetical protein
VGWFLQRPRRPFESEFATQNGPRWRAWFKSGRFQVTLRTVSATALARQFPVARLTCGSIRLEALVAEHFQPVRMLLARQRRMEGHVCFLLVLGSKNNPSGGRSRRLPALTEQPSNLGKCYLVVNQATAKPESTEIYRRTKSSIRQTTSASRRVCGSTAWRRSAAALGRRPSIVTRASSREGTGRDAG